MNSLFIYLDIRFELIHMVGVLWFWSSNEHLQEANWKKRKRKGRKKKSQSLKGDKTQKHQKIEGINSPELDGQFSLFSKD